MRSSMQSEGGSGATQLRLQYGWLDQECKIIAPARGAIAGSRYDPVAMMNYIKFGRPSVDIGRHGDIGMKAFQ